MGNPIAFIAEPGTYEMSMERIFDATPDRLYAAYTDPRQVPHWWGPRSYKVRVETLEARPGGQWRFVVDDPQSGQHAFRGVYHETITNERLVQTFMYEGIPGPGNVALETIQFEALPNGRTRLSHQTVFQSVAARDGMMQSSGGVELATDLWDRLEEIATR
jgi:uncharacterized protein YndB with AHSA1/START domain